MIICKICNTDIEGNGYCAEHSSGGSVYLEINPQPQEKPQEWEERWEKRFGSIYLSEVPISSLESEIKQFIRTEIKNTRKQTLKEVREILETITENAEDIASWAEKDDAENIRNNIIKPIELYLSKIR